MNAPVASGSPCLSTSQCTLLALASFLSSLAVSLFPLKRLFCPFGRHVAMYYYFASTVMGRRPKWKFLLTAAQVTQFVIDASDVNKPLLPFLLLFSHQLSAMVMLTGYPFYAGCRLLLCCFRQGLGAASLGHL